MTLRWRLALALALLSGLATMATASIAYGKTREQLAVEADRVLADRLPENPGQGRDDLVFEVREHGPSGVLSPRPGPGPGASRGRGGGSIAPQADTVLQYLLPDGTVLASTASFALPVDAADRELARHGGRPQARTVSVEDTALRVRTVSWTTTGGGAVQVARDAGEAQRVLSALRWRFVAVGLGVVSAAMVIGWFIAQRAAAPLRSLTNAAEHVAATGDLSATVPTSGADETGRLARAFATMLHALSRSREQQQQLVQDASHELRTPLTSLRTNIEVLERHPGLPPETRSALFADLRSELGELSALVTELVQLAADQRDDEPVEPVSLDELVARAAERAQRRHNRPIAVSGSGAIVTARRAALERAVSNLLDNAAKFSPPGAPIEVHLHWARIEVRDHGPGIEPAELDKVFDRFYRSSAARPLPGSGLGLSIVRQVVEDHGGKVFAGNHPDGGAIVGFELPFTGAPPIAPLSPDGSAPAVATPRP